MTEQTKILTKLRTEYESEQGKVDEMNVSVREIKAKMLEIREQIKRFENEIQTKQKSKDDLSENVTRRQAMVAYHQKQKKHLTEAMVKYEVSAINRSTESLHQLIHIRLLFVVERVRKVKRKARSIGGNSSKNRTKS